MFIFAPFLCVCVLLLADEFEFCSNLKLEPILNRFITDFNRILIEDRRLRTNLLNLLSQTEHQKWEESKPN